MFFKLYNAHILRLPECGKYDAMWTVVHQGQKLINSIHTVLPKISLNHCLTKCMLYLECKSISAHSENHLCMMHSSLNGENGTMLQNEEGWVHMETDLRVKNVGKFNP